MYVLLIVQSPPGLEEYQAHGLMQQFTGSHAAMKARAGSLPGCRALNNFAFELSGDYVRALIELQRGADDAGITTVLMTFPAPPSLAVTPSPRPLTP